MHKAPSATISEILPQFVEYMTAERRFSAATVRKYRDNVEWFTRQVGDLRVSEVRLTDFVSLKLRMAQRGARASRTAGIIFAVKSMLTFAGDFLGSPVLDLKGIKAPREPRREVLYLTEEEISRFLGVIKLETSWSGQPRLSGYCYRALIETLLASGIRISEALALDRDTIDIESREAQIIGKGNRQRTIFFTARAIDWINRYLSLRADGSPALFASGPGHRLTVPAVECMFRRLSRAANLEKRVTPHMLRHTTATTLLHNGCPVGFIKEVLGHQRLQTTCDFYLGAMTKNDTKKAFESYMKF